MSRSYKTKNGEKEGFVPGVGQIVDGKITVPDGVTIENANFELVQESSESQAAPVAPPASTTPTPTAVPPVSPQQPAPVQPTQTANQEIQ